MSLIPYYLQFVSEICEGKRPLPEGFALHETDDLKKAVELQTQIQTVGIPEFVRRCAAQTGEAIPQADYDAFDPNDLNAAIAQLAAERAPEPDEPAEPAEPVKTETRDIFEVFLDSVCLEDEIFRYLIDILRRGADGEFRNNRNGIVHPPSDRNADKHCGADEGCQNGDQIENRCGVHGVTSGKEARCL